MMRRPARPRLVLVLPVVVTVVLAACGDGENRPSISRPDITLPGGGQTPATDAPPADTAPPPGATETPPPGTEAAAPPPVTEAPPVAPPATEAPVAPPATEAPATDGDDGSGLPWWPLALIAIFAVAALTLASRRSRRSDPAAHHPWDDRAALTAVELQRFLAAASADPTADVRADVLTWANRLEDLAALAPDATRRAAAADALSSWRTWAAATEAAALTRGAMPPPTPEQLLSADDTVRARRDELEFALQRLQAPLAPTS